MKIAVWNMCNKADQSAAADKIREFFEDGCDAVALQEVPYEHSEASKPLSATLSTDMGLDHTFIHTRGLPYRGPERIAGYGTAILSTSSLASATHTTLRSDRWAYMTAGKGNQRAAVAFSHPSCPDVRIVIGHLSYRLVGKIGAAGLRDERVKLAQFLEAQSAAGRIIFAGDTNCRPGTGLDRIFSRAGLNPVAPSELTINHPTYRSRYPGLGSIQEPLDRVYADPILDASVTLGEYGPSDHRPLIIDISS